MSGTGRALPTISWSFFAAILPGMNPWDLQWTSGFDAKRKGGRVRHAWDVQGKGVDPTGKGLGLQVLSPFNGEVVYVDKEKEGQVTIRICNTDLHLGPVHMTDIGVAKGDKVSYGDYIGIVEMIGTESTGIHLHVQLKDGPRKKDKAYNFYDQALDGNLVRTCC